MELFTDNLNCCNKPCIVEPSSIFFSTFLLVALSARVSVCSTPVDFFFFSFFFYSLILSAIFFSNVFYFNITRYQFDVTTCELEQSMKAFCHVFSLLAILVSIVGHPILYLLGFDLEQLSHPIQGWNLPSSPLTHLVDYLLGWEDCVAFPHGNEQRVQRGLLMWWEQVQELLENFLQCSTNQ